MEYINKVELQGIITSIKVTELRVYKGVYKVADIVVRTEFESRNKDGDVAVEAFLHDCTAWEKSNVPTEIFNQLHEGVAVHLIGRIRFKNSIFEKKREILIDELSIVNK